MKLKFEMKSITLSPSLARIIAHICADGYLVISRIKRSKRELQQHPRKNIIRTRFSVRYVNNEKVLVANYIKDVKKTFGRKVVRTKGNEYDLSSKWTYDIIKKLGAGKSYEWFIAKEIMNASSLVKTRWLQAFFDDEAHVAVPQRRIVLNIVNLKGLKQIQRLLKEQDIDSSLNGPYKYKKYQSYHLIIRRAFLGKYSEKIGFTHPKKKAALQEIIKKKKEGV